MRKLIVIAFAGAMLMTTIAFAGINSHEVGAFLVYPYWKVDSSIPLRTFLTVTNDSASKAYNVHMALIDGRDDFCDECSFDILLTPYDTDLLELRYRPGGVTIYKWNKNSPKSFVRDCDFTSGFAVAFVEDASVLPIHRTVGDSVLHGDLVVEAYDSAIWPRAWSTSAISIQGNGTNDGDRTFQFNDTEYAAFPDILTTTYLTPGANPVQTQGTLTDAILVLFNLNYNTWSGPRPTTECPVNVFDSEEVGYNESFPFQCWSVSRLPTPFPGDANAYFWTDCSPGTHGLLFQEVLPVESGVFQDEAWGRPLFQSRMRDSDASFTMVPAP